MNERESQAGDPLRDARVERLVVVAPNWLGDAVMSLPALVDVLRANSGATVTLAARPSVAPLFRLVRGVSDVLELARGAAWRDVAGLLRGRGFDAALLMPNSFHAAWTAARAGIRERWGYVADWRGPWLTRRVARPGRVHQAAYYQHLTRALGFTAGPLLPSLDLTHIQREAGVELLRSAGWDGQAPLVVVAPGAAYGGAKKWPAASFAAVASSLARDSVVPVLIGTAADAQAGRQVAAAAGGDVNLLDLIGRTDLPTLAAVLAASRGLVTNDSGAMHLAAAVGVPVTAIFGPTDETATHPLGRAPHTILTHDVWCRPCMLRECPLRHRCMRGVTPEAVTEAAKRYLEPRREPRAES
jgi:heptosyltransferase-2